MRPPLQLLLLLIVSLALRGFAALPMPQHQAPMPVAHMAMSAHDGHCPEETAAAPANEHAKACQINCDLVAAAALPTVLKMAAATPPAVHVPTHPRLAIGETPPPDHPPPIL